MAEIIDKPIITKAQARERGLKKFFTGVPCKRGHVVERKVGDRSCIQCKRLVAQKEDSKNKRKEWYIAHRASELERKRKLWSENKENNAKKKRENYLKNKDAIKEKVKIYRKNNREKYRVYSLNRRSIKKLAIGCYTQKDLMFLMERQKGKCAECGRKISFHPKRKKNICHADHIMPLSKGGSNKPKNIQLLCASCNCSKQDLHPLEWAKKRGRLI